MAGQYGTKETKELLVLVKAAALAIIAAAKKDGFQPMDVLAFVKSAEFEKALLPAIQGVELVPAELGELGVIDGFDLGRFVSDVIDEILAALKAAPK